MNLSSQNVVSLKNKFADAELLKTDVSTRAIKKILMVGATTNEFDELSNADEAYLTATLRDLKEKGAPVASNFQINVVNIDPAFGGEDFLSGKYSADLVVLCLVYNPDSGEARDTEGFYAASPGISTLTRGTTLWWLRARNS